MARKTRVMLSLVADFDHETKAFNVKNNREGHLLVSKIKNMLQDIVQERKIKFLIKKSEACFMDDPESKIPELQDLYLKTEILDKLVDSLQNQTGKIEIQVINQSKSR